MNKKGHIETLEEFKDRHYGKIGTPYRNELEEGYIKFKMSVLIQEARKKKGSSYG